MRIGIKYCGGCNPRYDRVAAVKELQQRYPEWKIEPAGEGGQEYILVVCGCTAVCAGHAHLRPPNTNLSLTAGSSLRLPAKR